MGGNSKQKNKDEFYLYDYIFLKVWNNISRNILAVLALINSNLKQLQHFNL